MGKGPLYPLTGHYHRTQIATFFLVRGFLSTKRKPFTNNNALKYCSFFFFFWSMWKDLFPFHYEIRWMFRIFHNTSSHVLLVAFALSLPQAGLVCPQSNLAHMTLSRKSNNNDWPLYWQHGSTLYSQKNKSKIIFFLLNFMCSILIVAGTYEGKTFPHTSFLTNTNKK